MKGCLGHKKQIKLTFLSAYDRLSSNRFNGDIVSRSTELVDGTKVHRLSVDELQCAFNTTMVTMCDDRMDNQLPDFIIS